MRKALYIMGILSDADVTWMSAHGENRLVTAGTTIIHQGKPVDSIFIVLDGQFLVHTGAAEIARLLSGEVLGEISFVDSRPPSASVKAAVDSRVLAIKKDLLREKLGKDKHFASRFYLAVATFLADRLRVTTARLSTTRGVKQEEDVDELDPAMMENIARASVRFDHLLKRLSGSASWQQ
jgi:CRP-like cAMP-binding protein